MKKIGKSPKSITIDGKNKKQKPGKGGPVLETDTESRMLLNPEVLSTINVVMENFERSKATSSQHPELNNATSSQHPELNNATSSQHPELNNATSTQHPELNNATSMQHPEKLKSY